MVLNSAIDSKEEGAETPKRKGMETMNNKPDENPSLSSKTTGTFSEADLPLQNIVIWMMVSVAVGLLTIYTMVNWISNKLAEEANAEKKTDKQIEEPEETALENFCQVGSKHDTLTHNENILCHRNLPTMEKVASITEKSSETRILPKGDNTEVASVHVEQSYEDRKGFVPGNGTGECLVDVDVKSTECVTYQSNRQTTSVHLGPEFSGNLNLCLGSEELELGNAKNPNSQSEATIQQHNLDIDTAPQVTINYLQNKSLTCSYEMSNTSVVPACSEKSFTYSEKPQRVAAVQQLPSNTACDKQNDPAEKGHEGTASVPASTINCVKTIVKSLSCETSVSGDQTRTEFSPQSGTNSYECKENEQAMHDTTSVLKDSSNSDRIEDTKFTEDDNICSPTSISTQNKNQSGTKSVSNSLNYLTDYHTPQETTDGSVLSKNTNSEDPFMFPQDNEIETANKAEATNCPKVDDDMETRRSRYLRYIREDPVLSKSLDSQIESLERGCKLLEKKPLKSSLCLTRSVGSEGSLVDQKKKKYVHFPPDILDIRKVHKYLSFDEGFYADDPPKCDEKRRTQSFN